MGPTLAVAAAAYLACGYAAAREMEFPDDWLLGRLHRAAQFVIVALIWPYCVYRVLRHGWLP